MAGIRLWCCSCKDRYPILDRPSCLSLDIEAVNTKEFELVCSLWHTSTNNKNCNIWSCACDSLFCVKPAIKLQLVTKTKSLQMHCTELNFSFQYFMQSVFHINKLKNAMMWLSRNKNIHLLRKKKKPTKKQADTMENNWTQTKEQIVPIWPPQSLLC